MSVDVASSVCRQYLSEYVKVLVRSRVMYSFNFGRNRHIAL